MRYQFMCIFFFSICSGVATLSCTDSSATSSEDASNPGSPYSPPSNDDLLNLIANFKRQKPQKQTHSRSNRPIASGFVAANGDVENTTFVNPPSNASVSSISTISNTLISSASPRKAVAVVSVTTDAQTKPTNMLSMTTTTTAPLLSLLTSINTIKPKRIRGNTTGIESNSNASKRNRSDNNASTKGGAAKHSACDGSSNTAGGSAPNAANGSGANVVLDKNGSSEAMVGTPIAPKVVSGNVTSQHIFSPPNLGSQTKITGFFKSQLKTLPAVSMKKDLNNVMQYGGHSVATTTVASNGMTTQIGGGGIDKGLKSLCSVAAMSATSRTKSDAIQTNCNNLSVRALTSIIHSSNAAALKKLERKTAKVAPLTPIARKSNIAATKKTYPTVLPKKHVYIAPRTSNVIDASKSSVGAPTMLATSVKRTDLMHHHHHHQHHHQPNLDQKTCILQTKLPPPNGTKSAVTTDGSVYQLHPAPAMPKLVQIPTNLVGSTATVATATKDAPPSTPAPTSNLVINNGTTHYFLNGTVIKLQQMSTPQQVNTLNITTYGDRSNVYTYIHIYYFFFPSVLVSALHLCV